MSSPIPVVFLGSPEFAVPSLRALHEDDRLNVKLVVTQPDRPAGRNRRVLAPAVKQVATELGLPVFQPEQVNDPASVQRVRDVGPSVGVLVAYGEFLGQELLQTPPRGFLNVHPSLLPRYRGASPVQAAILNGDTETGVSIIQMVRQLDAGPILHQRTVPLSGSETSGILAERLAHIGAVDLTQVAVDWAENRISPTTQDENQATVTRKLRRSDAAIDWDEPALQIERLIRAMEPWPRAWTKFHGQQVSILSSHQSGSRDTSPPGTLDVKSDAVFVSTGSGWLQLAEVQPAGKRAMPAANWARGARIAPDERFG